MQAILAAHTNADLDFVVAVKAVFHHLSSSEARHIYFTNRRTKIQFLEDTGADCYIRQLLNEEERAVRR